ncbi:MAG: NUDIX domain-containing protein [Tenericutes bacterium]|nr:NUDIX domain-containing protein [Mycoplasmatota bacterium]
MKKEKSCGCVVFNEEKKVLLVRMRQGHYSFPKGHVEENESEYQTAIREVKEETNIECEIIDGFRCISTYSPFPKVVKDVVFFVAKSTTNDIIIQEEEVSSCGFYSVEEIRNLLTFSNDLDVFLKAVEFFDTCD